MADNKSTKEVLVSRAWIAKKLKRYDDMYACIRVVAQSGESLNKRERTMFYLAYQYALRPYRDGWYKLLVITDLIDGSRRKMQLTKEYKEYVEKQWTEYCMEVITTIDSILLPRVSRPRPRAFYLKMRADFTRYLIEIAVKRKRLIRETKAAYLEANELCEEKLSPAHPLRLAVALNLAVFYAHVQKKKELAITTAKAALVEGEKVLGSGQIEGKSRLKKVTNLLQLLRDNIAYWAPRGSDEEEINEPILKGESIKEAKMLSRADFAAGAATGAGASGDSKGVGAGGKVGRAAQEGKYGPPTLVNEYDGDLAEEAAAIANQVILIETFKSPPPSEEDLSSDEEGKPKKGKRKGKGKDKDKDKEGKSKKEAEEEAELGPSLTELLDAEEAEEGEETSGEEEEEESEDEWGGEDWEWEGEGYEGRGRRRAKREVSTRKPRKMPPDGIVPYVFSRSEDDFLYKKVIQEELYLAELVANNEATEKRNEEIMAMKLAPKSTESQLDTESAASKSTTVLGEKLSGDSSGSSSSESGEEGEKDDRYPDTGDQEAEDRLVEQILDEFFKADLDAAKGLGEDGGALDESCISSTESLTSAAGVGGSGGAAGARSSVSFMSGTSYSGTTIPSKSTFLGELKKKRRKRLPGADEEGEDEEEESDEEEEEEEEEEMEGEGDEEMPGEEGEVERAESVSSQGSYDSLMSDFNDLKDDDSMMSVKMEEPGQDEVAGEAEEEEAAEEDGEEEEEEEEETPPGGEEGAADGDTESVAGSKAGGKHKKAKVQRTRSRAGSFGGGSEEESSSDESNASSASSRTHSSRSHSSGSVSSTTSSTTSRGAERRKKTHEGDGFHPLPPGPKTAFDQVGYVDEFSKVVRDVETSLDDFEFSRERFQEIDRILEFLEDQEERREIAESEGHHFDAMSSMHVEDPLVKLMFTEFRIVYPEYDHDVTAGVSIGDEDDSSSGESSQDEAGGKPRASKLPGVTQEDIVAMNEAEDKAEIQCLLQYPEDFKEYEEQSFQAEYIKITKPEPPVDERQSRGYGYGYEYGGEGGDEELGEMDEFNTIMEPRATATDDGPVKDPLVTGATRGTGTTALPRPSTVKSSSRKSVRLKETAGAAGSKVSKSKIRGSRASTAVPKPK